MTYQCSDCGRHEHRSTGSGWTLTRDHAFCPACTRKHLALNARRLTTRGVL